MLEKIVDEICDEFESSLQRGDQPSIEELLATAGDDLRAELLEPLMALELEYQVRRGGSCYIDEWQIRFSGDRETVLNTFRSFLWEGSDSAIEHRCTDDLMLRHFRLKALIGRGAFGTVWLAFDSRLERDVAIKTPHCYVRPGHDGVISAPKEAATAARLRHAHILAVHDVSEIHGHWFMVTDFVTGGTLAEHLKTHSFSCHDAAVMASQIADGVAHAHSQGVVHRDLKPSNVLLDDRGNLLLADFGLAVSPGGPIPNDGFVCGSRAYMSPEQERGIYGGPRADLYSLGKIIDDLLEAATANDSVSTATVRPSSKAPAGNAWTTRWLGRIRERCCQCDPELRYGSADEVFADLAQVVAGRPPRTACGPRSERLAWNARRMLIPGSLGLLLLVMAIAIAARHSVSPPPHPDARLVRITTDPPGCELTIVPLDPVTDDPIPERLEKLSGKTPIETHLLPGDYLMVAVLDETHWLEVTRHIPARHEVMGYGSSSRRWRIRDGVIVLHDISIRSPLASIPMVVVPDSKGLLVSSPGIDPNLAERVDVPAFYVSTTTMNRESLLKRRGVQEGSPAAGNVFLNLARVIERTEFDGCRLASAAEYAAMVAHAKFLSKAGVRGVDDDVLEWTSSRPGARGAGIRPRIPVRERPQCLVMGAGGVILRNCEGAPVLQPTCEDRDQDRQYRELDFRYVRSIRPRTTPGDFVKSQRELACGTARPMIREKSPDPKREPESALPRDTAGRDK
ncbi:Serine/threonine-protein kinase PrkC [Caulifigura coniformis]|uniref:Serine/threonine-protein kinase PrkC n=1 Tax=Caulifigura coniformis TaxID=2527983 RepID=A0A517SKB2_9PLAN|nr:serine/threonine-protein kinase [Caulifigura coniformis]QDT56558.1 Serine/threonine-protein kinase PrkC [Caulifigura coniformis]